MASTTTRQGTAADGPAPQVWAAIGVLAAVLAASAMAHAETSPAPRATPAAGSSQPCAVCGKVESVRKIDSSKPASGVGAVAGSVVGGVVGHQVGSGRGRTVATVAGAGAGALAGHTVEKKRNTSQAYEVAVRMQDGSIRTVKTATAPPVGQAVTLKGNALQPAGNKKQ